VKQYKPSEEVDFLIIGAGAAGGVIAKELSTAGFSVVVLEQGPYLREKDFDHDEIKYTRLSAMTNDLKKQPHTYRKSDVEPAKVPERKIMQYGRQVGGGSVHFTANYWRLWESDFRQKSQWGGVAGASLVDWPVSYADLEPYYTKGEEELGISGLAGANPFEAPRSKPYPLPPLPVKSSGAIFERATRKLGLHPFPAPMAILSQPYRGRGACVHCGFCETFGCEMRAKSSTLATVIPMAERAGRCEIRPDSYTRKIEINANGRVTGAIYFDRNRSEVFQKAKAVIVGANGSETPRLLLMSKSSRFPQGLANSNGLVGKYLMFDSGFEAFGLFEHPLNEFKSVQTTRAIHDFYEPDPKRGFYGGGGIDARFDFYPVSFALNGLPPGAPRWGSEWKAMVAKNFTRTLTLLAHATCLAQERNSITLDPDVKDSWGLPAVRVTFDFHPDDVSNMKFLLERQVEILQATTAQRVWTDMTDLSLLPHNHLMGTCRMGDDPKTSVVDRYHRVHDVPNLFLVDGSSLVTACCQPTCTIQALAYRAADHIAGEARRAAI
jgi:choline dehydrogenase-like flavoprotein